MSDEGVETRENARVRRHREDKPSKWAYLGIFLSSILMAGTSVIVSIKYADNNDRKWCDIVQTMDDAYHQPRPPGSPPLTPTGVKLATDMHRLRTQLGCNS